MKALTISLSVIAVLLIALIAVSLVANLAWTSENLSLIHI